MVLGNLTLGDLENMSFVHGDLALDTVSYMIFMPMRFGVDINSYDVEIIPLLGQGLSPRCGCSNVTNWTASFATTLPYPLQEKWQAISYCHVILSTMIDFDFVPMACISGQPQIKDTRVWYSSHFKDSTTLEAVLRDQRRLSA
jgi:hypothetical protein